MKKLIALLTVFGFLTFGIANNAFAQKQQKADEPAATEQVAEEVAEAPAAARQNCQRIPMTLSTKVCTTR